MPLSDALPQMSVTRWREQLKTGTLRPMKMALSLAWRVLAVCVVVTGTLTTCSSEFRSDVSPEGLSSAGAAPEQSTEGSDSSDEAHRQQARATLAAAASGHATEALPTLLLIVNKTPNRVVLTSVHGQATTVVEPGASVQFASKRVCGWLPLKASTANGRLIDQYSAPCTGQTWTITEQKTG